MNPNPGYLAGLAKASALRKSATAAKASKVRTTEKKLNSMQAVGAARGSANDLFKAWKERGCEARDFALALVFSEPDHLGKLAPDGVVIFDPTDWNADSNDLIQARKHWKHVAVGFIVCWLDRQKKPEPEFVAHARPLLLDDKSLALLEYLVATAADLRDWKLS
jgi:hypothetical protein